jgi:hypothetical protein
MSLRQLASFALLSWCSSVGCRPKTEPATDCGTDAACQCQVGDPDCSACQAGYRQSLLDSSCVPTCKAADFDCGAHGACEESVLGATCRCEPGYTGASCASCEAGLSLNASKQCVGKLSVPSLLTLRSDDKAQTLGALVPPAWRFSPLATVSSTATDLAYDASSRSVYFLDAGALWRVPLSTGKSTQLTPSGVDLGRWLGLDQAGKRAITASDAAIYQVGLDNFEVSELAGFGAAGLDYDGARGLVVGVDRAGQLFELSGSEPRQLGPAPELEALGMAFDAFQQRAYFVGSEPETQEERLLRYCREALGRLGALTVWQSQVVVDVPAGAETYSLDYELPDSALVASALGSSVGSVRVTTGHPDAAVCIVADGGGATPLEIEVTAEAQPRFLLISAPERRIALDVTALSVERATSVIVHTEQRLTVAGSSLAVTEYGGSAWLMLGLGSLGDFAPKPASRLVLFDWASQSTLPLTLPQAVGSALAWVGKAP